MEIEIEIQTRNRNCLHPQIAFRIHQSSYLISIKALSLGIKQLDEEIKNSFPSDVKIKKYVDIYLQFPLFFSRID